MNQPAVPAGPLALQRESPARVIDLTALAPTPRAGPYELTVIVPTRKEVAFPLGERRERQSNTSARQLVSYLRQLIALRLAASRALLSAFLKFSAVGASGVAMNTFLLWLLTERISHLPYLAASFIATQFAIVWNFTLLEGLVFSREKKQTRARRFGKFWLLNLGLLPVQLALLAFGVEALNAKPVVTNLVVLGVVFGLRYAATTCWVYRDQNVAALSQPTVGRAASSYRSTLRYSLRLALPPVATLVVYPNLVLNFGALGLASLSLALLAIAAWSALWVRSSAPRQGEPDVHDRQVDIILGIPVLAVAVWLSLSSMHGSALATPLTNRSTIALPLFLTGTSVLLLGTRMASRLRWVLVLPLFLLPALTARPGLVGFLLVTAALLATGRLARGRRHRTDHLSTLERWSLSRRQQLPRVKRALAVVSVVALVLPLSAVLAHSPHAPSHLLTPGSASANAAPSR